jgi:hypothetical protein
MPNESLVGPTYFLEGNQQTFQSNGIVNNLPIIYETLSPLLT